MANFDRWFLKQTSHVAGSSGTSTSGWGCTSIDHESFGKDELTNENQGVDDVATSTISWSQSEDAESSDEEEPSTEAISSSSDGERSLTASKRYKSSSTQNDEVEPDMNQKKNFVLSGFPNFLDWNMILPED